MSFDQDPKEQHERFLLQHTATDKLFEVFSRWERDYVMHEDLSVIDVTGEECAEMRFRMENE